MSELTLDDILVDLFASLKEETILLDSAGKEIGRFWPADGHENYRNPFTQEDLDKAEQALSEGEAVK